MTLCHAIKRSLSAASSRDLTHFASPLLDHRTAPRSSHDSRLMLPLPLQPPSRAPPDLL